MDMNAQRQDFWDLDLRVEPARQSLGKIGLTMTGTATIVLSRLATGCGYSEMCPQRDMDAYGARR